MEYAKKILQDEKESLLKALDGWKSTEYKEAFKDRNNKLNDINKVLKLIDNGDRESG